MAGTYKSGSAARSYVASNEQLGGIIYNDLGAFESLPVVAGDTAVMDDTKAILSASFLSHSGSVIQALNFLKASSDAGSGDVVGPASSTDNAVARFDLTTGKLLQDSTLLVSDGASPTIGIAADADLLTIASGVLTVAGEVTAATYESAGSAFAVDAAGAVTAVGIAAGGAITGATTISGSGALSANAITNAEFTVDAAGNTDIDGTLNVEGVPTFQAAAVFSSGITTANAIAGATTIVASGLAEVGLLDVASNAFIVDGVGNITSNALASFSGPVSSSIGIVSQRMIMTGSGGNCAFKASGSIMAGGLPMQIGNTAKGAGINDIPYIQMMGVDAGGLLQEYKFQVSGGILQVNEV